MSDAPTITLDEILSGLMEAAKRKRERAFDFFMPYPKQNDFFRMGLTKRERLLIAGNQLGKTEAGAFEMACHLTGEYPVDWVGRKFDHPVMAWCAGEGALAVRDVIQKKLCGKAGVDADFGTGMIPKSSFVDKPALSRGITDAFDTIQVRHYTNGIEDGVSVLSFKSYEQGRKKFQGDTLHVIWLDEEPPEEVYSECLTRITASGGMIYITFTPLQGRSNVVIRFLNDETPDRGYVTMTIYEAAHIPEEKRASIIAGYPAHERQARAMGVPMLGSGRIFSASEEMISEATIENVPVEWAKLWGLDFGIDHPFAAALYAWDKDADIIHVLHAIRMADALPIQHAAAMKPIAANVMAAWPQDGTARESNGEELAQAYKKHKVLMLPEHATHATGGVSTEAGILEMEERMTTGRLKVAAHLSDWFEEYRFYHRKDGLIVKIKDDIMSATRVGIMMRRFARPGLLGSQINKRRRQGQMASGIDFNLF